MPGHAAATAGPSSAGRRPVWRAYLLLSRVSNLPTVWSNVLGGVVAAGAAATAGPGDVLRLALGVSCLYTAGMFLNDAFDRHIDARQRPDRPLPAGDVTLRAVVTAGAVLLGAGALLASAGQPHPGPAAGAAAVLAAAIVLYDYRHKQNPLGPLVMGLCRGLVYVVVAAGLVGALPAATLAAFAVQTGYVLLLTEVAKRVGPRAGVVVPLLIAGISLVDAAIILAAGGGPALALTAAAGFVLTLALQRYVPGT